MQQTVMASSSVRILIAAKSNLHWLLLPQRPTLRRPCHGQALSVSCSRENILPEGLAARPPQPWLLLLRAGAGLTAAAVRVRGVSTPTCGVTALPDPPGSTSHQCRHRRKCSAIAMHAAFIGALGMGEGAAQGGVSAFGHTSIVCTLTGPCPSGWSTLAACFTATRS